jgi:hypothetical protein
MCWSEIGEFTKAVAPVFTAAAAWAAVWIGWRGLEKWRAETIGKRKAELAEEMLSGFYQMRDIIGAIRSPAVFGEEGKDRPRAAEDENDADAVSRAKDTYYVPIARYNESQTVIADLMAKRYRMKAMFGSAADKPFRILHRVLSLIIGSARKLIIVAGKPATETQSKTRQIWETHISWGAGEDSAGAEDAIDADVRSAIEAVEDICRPILEARANEPARRHHRLRP